MAYKDVFLIHGFCVHGLNQAVHHRKTFRYCHDNDGGHQHNSLCDQKKYKYWCDCFICSHDRKNNLQDTCDRCCRNTKFTDSAGNNFKFEAGSIFTLFFLVFIGKGFVDLTKFGCIANHGCYHICLAAGND